MDDASEEEVLRQLKWENKMLKQRVFELEEKLQKVEPPSVKKEHDSSVMKLLRTKDERLEKYASEMEQKRSELKNTIQELETRNAQLSLSVSTLRLYQEIFENEAAAMIGVDRDGKVILFNRTAPQVLGEKLRSALHQPIETVDFASFDPSTPALVRATLQNRQPSTRSVRVRDRQVTTVVYPLGSQGEPTGALVKIGVTSA
jgi:PAS domain S-box-containing protein